MTFKHNLQKDRETFKEQWKNEKLNEENCAAHLLVLLLLTPAVIIKSLLYRAIWMIRNWIQVHKKHLDIKRFYISPIMPGGKFIPSLCSLV